MALATAVPGTRLTSAREIPGIPGGNSSPAETQSPLSPSRFNGGDCKVAQVMYDTSLARLNIYIV